MEKATVERPSSGDQFWNNATCNAGVLLLLAMSHLLQSVPMSHAFCTPSLYAKRIRQEMRALELARAVNDRFRFSLERESISDETWRLRLRARRVWHARGRLDRRSLCTDSYSTKISRANANSTTTNRCCVGDMRESSSGQGRGTTE
ncbi:hypothetical protein F5Y18DRAFT_195403 [Xylariaceae sp. FL1019]|nr:hypothetical protein F5Y18DRAFT_195403 [Xylariaceae sp. FL1019]